jgi:hypothetical protein
METSLKLKEELNDREEELTETESTSSDDMGGFLVSERGVACIKCGKSGHWSSDCPLSMASNSRKCYRCGEPGHIARNCTEADKRICYRCGEPGHLARNCTKNFLSLLKDSL